LGGTGKLRIGGGADAAERSTFSKWRKTLNVER